MKISLMLLIALIPTLIVWGVIIYVVYLLIVALKNILNQIQYVKKRKSM